MGQEKFQIKGSSLSSKFEFAAQHLGPQAKTQLTEWFDKKTGSRVVLDANWYPFSVYSALLQKLADDWMNGQLESLREVGSYSAQKALASVYEVYAREKNFHRFLERISMLHGRLYSNSRLTVMAHGEDFCEVEVLGIPDRFEAAAQVAAGFYTGAARLMGLDKVRCEFVLEADRALYRLDW